MQITLNNKTELIDKDEVSVNELLEIKKFTFKMLIIKINGQLIKKHEYDSRLIKDGDEVTVLHLVSGG